MPACPAVRLSASLGFFCTASHAEAEWALFCCTPPTDDGAGTIYPSSLCALKSYPLRPGQEPKFYSRGPIVPWTSGFVIT